MTLLSGFVLFSLIVLSTYHEDLVSSGACSADLPIFPLILPH